MPVGIYVEYTSKSFLMWTINIKQGAILLINCVPDAGLAIILIALLKINSEERHYRRHLF